MASPHIADKDVKAVFDAYPVRLRSRLLALRGLIFDAAKNADVGKVTETLKWGEPAYLPARPKVGTTIRLNAVKGSSERYLALFHCQTTLLSTFRELYPKDFVFEGERALVFSVDGKVPAEPFKHCVALALTYHKRK